MKTFEERKEEILRRSQTRIRRRNAITRHIAALCIPVVFTVAILLLPKQDANNTVPDSATTVPEYTAAPEQAMGAECSITVSKNGQLLIHDNETAVDAIRAALDAICSREQEPVVENFGGDLQTSPSSLAWKITVIQEDTSIVYCLDGTKLTLNGMTWLLTDSEKQTLCRLLGLPPM